MKKTRADRRSVVVKPEVDARVRDMIAAATRYRLNLDYTKALNLLAELGGKWLEDSSPEGRKKFSDVIGKYLDFDVFEKSVVDEWAELGEFRRWKKAKASLDAAKTRGSNPTA